MKTDGSLNVSSPLLMPSTVGLEWPTLAIDETFEPDAKALELVPAAFAQQHLVFPVRWEKGVLQVNVGRRHRAGCRIGQNRRDG